MNSCLNLISLTCHTEFRVVLQAHFRQESSPSLLKHSAHQVISTLDLTHYNSLIGEGQHFLSHDLVIVIFLSSILLLILESSLDLLL